MGKTFVASHLTQYLHSLGLKALTIKPIETGVNDFPCDAKNHLLNAQKIFPTLTLQDIVLFTFPLPASPFVADTQGSIDLSLIFSHISSFEGRADVLLVEGAGGLFVPIKKDYFMLDFACELQERYKSEVIFVCDDRLGMLNRLLSGRYILQNKNLAHHLFINLREQKSFEEISLPFLVKSQTSYHTDLDSLVEKIFQIPNDPK